jgi:hypothetical protein
MFTFTLSMVCEDSISRMANPFLGSVPFTLSVGSGNSTFRVIIFLVSFYEPPQRPVASIFLASSRWRRNLLSSSNKSRYIRSRKGEKIRHVIKRLTKEKAALSLWKLEHVGKEYGLEAAKARLKVRQQK